MRLTPLRRHTTETRALRDLRARNADLARELRAAAQVIAQQAAAIEALGDEAERQRRRAGEDPLTGLLNRRGMRDIWSSWCRDGRHALSQRVGGLALLDLDLFKAVNDEYGHPAGDVVLGRLADLIRQHGLLGVRLGGDEFAVFLPPSRRSRDTDPLVLMRCLATEMAEPIAVDPRTTVRVTLSIGIVNLDEVTGRGVPEEWRGHLLGRADRRLYAAKESGRARIVGPGR